MTEPAMEQGFSEIGVLFVAGFGPITRDAEASRALYADTLGLPLKPYGDNQDYLSTEDGELEGCRQLLKPAVQVSGFSRPRLNRDFRG